MLLSDEKAPSLDEVVGAEEFSSRDDDSDSDARQVPDIARAPSSASAPAATSTKSHGGRKRATLPAEKEHKRMKRLLRNRVSAQQARERKKAYLTGLEGRTKELGQRNAELEDKVSTLQRENAVLRKIIRNTSLQHGNSSAEQ